MDNIKKIKGLFQELPLIQTRHKLAAHALNYSDQKAGTKYSFVIHQFEMEDSNVSFFNNHTNQFESIDLIEELDSYMDLVIDILEKLLKKLIGTVFSTSREKREEYEKELAYLKSGMWNI